MSETMPMPELPPCRLCGTTTEWFDYSLGDMFFIFCPNIACRQRGISFVKSNFVADAPALVTARWIGLHKEGK